MIQLINVAYVMHAGDSISSKYTVLVDGPAIVDSCLLQICINDNTKEHNK